MSLAFNHLYKSLPKRPQAPPIKPTPAAINKSINDAAANSVNMYPEIKDILESKSKFIL